MTFLPKADTHQLPRLGIDLGGTKIAATALNSAGETLWQTRIPSPHGASEATVKAICELVREAEAHLGQTGLPVGLGIPGAISPASGVVKNANSTWLIGFDLAGALEADLARPVAIANDANCLALSEATDGAAQGASIVLGVILGTGMGSGWVVGGRPITGANAIAGEIGHNPMPGHLPADDADHRCYCGRLGCVETYLSGPALAKAYARRAGRTVAANQLEALAESGDTNAAAVLDAFFDGLAAVLASAINTLDPDVIVLGGGLSNIKAIYSEVPRRWQTHVFSDTIATQLRPPAHGDASGVRGAAYLSGMIGADGDGRALSRLFRFEHAG